MSLTTAIAAAIVIAALLLIAGSIPALDAASNWLFGIALVLIVGAAFMFTALT